MTLDFGDVSVGSSETLMWIGQPSNVGTVENGTFSVEAQELSGPISGRQEEDQTTLVVDELFKLFLPMVTR